MLVLTRKLMEKLFIGDDICVTVVRLEGGQVRLGIDAPREVSVVRAELVPERTGGRPRNATAGAGPASVPGPGPGRTPPPMHTEIRTQPPVAAHGIDSRRRGRSQ
jgi:carbon storage regulator